MLFRSLNQLQRILSEKKLALELTPAARALVIKDGYDPLYGARPLRRAIQRLIQDPLALDLLDGKFQPGDRILGDAAGDVLKFKPFVEEPAKSA